MSIYSNVTEKDLENLRKLAYQQKNERAEKIKNRILKQTHDIKLAESLSPITDKLDNINESAKKSLTPINEKLDNINESAKKSLTPINEKLDNINDSTIKLGDIIRESNSSSLLKDTFKSLSDDESNALKIVKDEGDNMTILSKPIKSLGGDKILLDNNKVYDLSTEMHKALSNSSYTGKSMRDNNDQLKLYNFLTDLGYTKNRGKQTSQMKFFTKILNKFKNIKKEEPLVGEGIQKIIIPSNIIDIYTRLEILLGLKISGHTDTLSEASTLIDELYKQGEI